MGGLIEGRWVANSAHATYLREKCGVFALVSFALQAASHSCQYRRAFSAPLALEKNNIVIVKSSLRHWLQVPTLFITPLPTTACIINKSHADRAGVCFWQLEI
jgi:hypothetical protein